MLKSYVIIISFAFLQTNVLPFHYTFPSTEYKKDVLVYRQGLRCKLHMPYVNRFKDLKLSLSPLVRVCSTLEIENENSEITIENCSTLKDDLARVVSEFTFCSVNHSRPITLCKNCIDTYINLLESYTNMSKVYVNGTRCLDYYINLDRLQILETQYSNSVNLWNRAKCYECYLVENGNQTGIESDASKQFRMYYDDFITCTHKTDTKALCTNCMNDYVVLSDYYTSISNANERIGVCSDLEDIMNGTWTYWSTNCCKYRKHNEYIFIGSTAGVLIITVLLYVLVQFCGEKKAPTIIQQTRFASESINRF